MTEKAAESVSEEGSSKAVRTTRVNFVRSGALTAARFLSRRNAFLADDVTGIS